MRFLAFLLLIGLTPLSWGSESIPLDSVWGYRVKGTQDIRDLDPDSFGRSIEGVSPEEVHQRFLSSKVLRLDQHFGLRHLVIDQPNPHPCLVVVGENKEAFDRVVRVVLEEEPTSGSFPSGEALSLFIASPQTSYAFNLVAIERDGKRLVVRYAYRLRSSSTMSTPLAMASLGVLPAGKYEVALEPVEIKASGSENGTWPGHRIKQPRFLPGVFEIKETS